MTDAPEPKTSPVGPQESRAQSGSSPRTNAPGLTQGDPERPAFGDQTDDMSKRLEPSKVDDKGAKEDLPRPVLPQSKPLQQRPTAPPTNVQGKSGSDCDAPTQAPEVKATRTLSDGRAV